MFVLYLWQPVFAGDNSVMVSAAVLFCERDGCFRKFVT